MQQPMKVFISYSHKDEKWLEQLQVFLKRFERDGYIDIWDDTRIQPSQKWREEIQQALNGADVAILLVSAHFLTSDFISETELPPILKAAERSGTKILPVIISPSWFEETPLSQFQCVEENGPERPLIKMTPVKRQEVLLKISDVVKKELEVRRSEPVRMLTTRAVDPLYDFANNPIYTWDKDRKEEEVDGLRKKLLVRKEKLEEPTLVRVHGTLFPCTLLTPGWWDLHEEEREEADPVWQDGLQKWLFNGFDMWGPSWDYSWNFDDPSGEGYKPFYIAQLGDRDEADSVPVIIPYEKGKLLWEAFQENRGGVDAKVQGVLTSREHVIQQNPSLSGSMLHLAGGTLDYCISLQPDEEDHHIDCPGYRHKIDLYSGYLWKCVIPKKWLEESNSPRLDQVYFIWEHTNFADEDAVKYNLDSLEHKESYIRSMHGDNLVLLQKSSWLVPGEPRWPAQQFYNNLVRRQQRV